MEAGVRSAFGRMERLAFWRAGRQSLGQSGVSFARMARSSPQPPAGARILSRHPAHGCRGLVALRAPSHKEETNIDLWPCPFRLSTRQVSPGESELWSCEW